MHQKENKYLHAKSLQIYFNIHKPKDVDNSLFFFKDKKIQFQETNPKVFIFNLVCA